MTTQYPAAVDPIDPLPSTPDRSDDQVEAIQKYVGVFGELDDDGEIPVANGVSGTYVVTKNTAAALTLAAPTVDGQRITVVSATAAAHVITTADLILDGTAGANETATFAAQAGASISLVGHDGVWLTTALVAVTPAPGE